MTVDLVQNPIFSRLKMQKSSALDKFHAQKLNLLKADIEDSKAKLKSAQENFNNVIEPKLIDFYIYKIQAEQSRFSQLLSEYRNEEQMFRHTSS